MAKLARDAGFQQATVINTDGKPGVFATLDAGAAKTVGLYFMYDVKQFDPAEWTSPPLKRESWTNRRLGKAIVGRGAVNQKGPEAAFLAALHAIRGAGKKMPVNLVMVAEGEEEIGSPHIAQLVRRPEVQAALKKCVGVFMPSATQDLDGVVTVNLGLERRGRAGAGFERREMGTRSGQGYSFLAQGDGGQPGVAFGESAQHARLRRRQRNQDRQLSEAAAAQRGRESDDRESVEGADEAQTKKQFTVQHWINDLPWEQANERLESQPTVNIEGLVGGYTGPGGKTVLPHRAVAKIDMRLVPDMKAADALAALKAHLAKRGFGDIEVNMTGGYDPTSTSADSALDPGAGCDLQAIRNRSAALAAQRRLVSGICFHRRTAETCRRTFRARPRQRRACAG